MTSGYGDLGWEEFGGGVSLYDFNGDGWDDLSFPSAKGDSLLFFQNNQGIFEKIEALVIDTLATKQLLWADIDNDGDQDLYITSFQAANRLYENDGNMNLTDITTSAGFMLFPDPSYGAAFGDYDLDGFLDLYITNRSNGISDNYTNLLYKNNGDNTFTNVTIQTNTSDGYKVSFCASFLDINHNLFPDIYIANDRVAPNTLLLNEGNGSFSDISASSNTGIVMNAMNVSAADYNNDSHLDIYITNTPEGNALFSNNGDETFTEVAVNAGVAFNQVSWGASFFDYDNDADLDLYVSSFETGVGKNNGFFENLDNGTFSSIIPNGMEGDTTKSFGNAIGDFNQDGLIDIVVSNVNAPIMLWENQTSNNNNWLKINLEGVVSNRDGIGSWIEVYTNGQKQVRYTQCGTGYLGQNSKNEHFGLGSFTQADSVIVFWSSGEVDKLENVDANQTLYIQEQMTINSLTNFSKEKINFSISPNPISSHFFFIKNSFDSAVEAEIQLYTSSGQIIFNQKKNLLQGKNRFDLPSKFPSGVYNLNIKSKNFSEWKQLVFLNE